MLKLIDTFDQIRDDDIITIANKLSSKKVLEIGCGGGERTTLFVEAGSTVIAVDIIDARKSEFSYGYDFFIADGKELPFEDGTFDAVVSFDVIEHISKDNLFLSETYRVCKKGGFFFMGTPNRNRLSNKLRKFFGKKIVYPLTIGEGCIHLREYTMDEFNELVSKVGFKVIQKKYIWVGLVGIIGFKRFPAVFNRYVQYLSVYALKP
jgi:2-polyprenyl-3-methyl-5-hydroxy-6-metoxy-1,4-benzoquinol methylase